MRDWETLKEHALYQLQNDAAWFRATGQPVFGDPPADVADLESRGVYLCRTPDEIVAAIRADHDYAPFTRHNFWATLPGIDPKMATRSIEPFARDVIPQLLSDVARPLESSANITDLSFPDPPRAGRRRDASDRMPRCVVECAWCWAWGGPAEGEHHG
jgi:hypothetical protein